MIERLETRRLLAVTTNFVGGVLTVTGDGEANAVNLSRNLDTGQLVVRAGDATVGSAPYAEVTSITVNLLGGNDRLQTATNIAKPMNVNGGEGGDFLAGGAAADTIHGGPGNDTVNGNGGNDNLFGDDGADTLDGGAGGDSLSGGGGEGTDTVTYASRAGAVRVTLDNLANDGTPPNAELPEGERDNVRLDIERVIGGRGNDFLSAAPVVTANGTITPARITFEGGPGNDTLNGASGGEAGTTAIISTLNGGDGNDTLNGGSKNDALNGGGGADTMNGNAGNDTMNGGAGPDVFNGGEGSDLATYADRAGRVVVTLDNVANDGSPANAELPEGERDNVMGNVERVAGGRGNDSITGNDAANTFSGGDGDDTINGGGGADVIEGGRGNDTLHGNAGNDNIFGGTGNDNLFGDEDNDFLHARDGLADVVDGGAGTEDRAERDADLDTVSNVEIIVV